MKQVFELNLSADQYIKGLADINTSIRTLRAEQKELDLTTANGQQKFEQNAVAIKGLSEQYRLFQKEVANLGEKNNDLKTKTDAVNVLMQKEATTINELNQQTAALNKVKKNLNIENEEEKALIDQINKKIDENTNKVKANSSEVEKQKINADNYTNSIKDAFASINPLNGGLSGFISRSQEAGGTGKLFTQALGGMVQGVWGLVKASLAFIATPIGAALAIIAGAIMLVKTALSKSEAETNKMKVAFSGFKGILNAVFAVLKPFVSFLIDGVVKGAELATKAMSYFSAELREQIKLAREAEQVNQRYNDEQRKAKTVMLEYQREAEKLRQQRDDDTKSIKERIAANEQLGETMKKQLGEEMRIAALGVEAVQRRIKAEGESSELLDLQAEKMQEMSDIAERITGQESEQLTNRNALLKEEADKRKEASDRAKQYSEEQKQRNIKEATDELVLWEAKENGKRKTIEQSIQYESELKDKRLALLETEYINGAKNIKEYETEKLNILKTYNDAVFQATSENLTKELELWKSQNAKKLADNKITSDAVLSGQLALQDTLYEKQKTVIEKTILNEQEKAIALQNLQNEHETAVQGIKDTFKQYQRGQEATDYEIEQERLSLQFENELVIAQSQYEREKELLLQQLEDKKLTQEQYDQIMLNKKQEYENKMFQIESARQMASWDLQQKTVSVFGEVASAIGIKSKGLSIALTTIDTYFAAQKAYLSQFLPVPDPSSPARGTIAAVSAIASGIARVRQIANTKFSRGGWLNGRSHAGGGIPMTIAGVGGYEAEGGEAIINKRSSALYRPILSAINQAGGGVAFAQGGLTTGSDRVTDAIFNQIDITSQLSKIKVVNVAEETAVLYNGILKVENRANV